MKNLIDKFSDDEEMEPLNFQQKNIIKWLKNIRFKRKFFGGVSEQDVWKKITKLNQMYNIALIAERQRYDTLLEEHGVINGEGYISNSIKTSMEER